MTEGSIDPDVLSKDVRGVDEGRARGPGIWFAVEVLFANGDAMGAADAGRKLFPVGFDAFNPENSVGCCDELGNAFVVTGALIGEYAHELALLDAFDETGKGFAETDALA